MTTATCTLTQICIWIQCLWLLAVCVSSDGCLRWTRHFRGQTTLLQYYKECVQFFYRVQAYPCILGTSDLFCGTRSIQIRVVSRLFSSKHVLSKSCQHGGTNGEYTTKCSCLLLTLQCLGSCDPPPVAYLFTQAHCWAVADTFESQHNVLCFRSK